MICSGSAHPKSTSPAWSTRSGDGLKTWRCVVASRRANTITPVRSWSLSAPRGWPATAGTLQAEAKAYFISISTGNVFPVFSNEALLGRFDSVTGMRPEVDLTNEDQSRNISRRHARLVIKDGVFFIAEEIGTMNGTFLNGKKLANGVLTPIKDGDELILCRLALSFKTPASMNR